MSCYELRGTAIIAVLTPSRSTKKATSSAVSCCCRIQKECCFLLDWFSRIFTHMVIRLRISSCSYSRYRTGGPRLASASSANDCNYGSTAFNSMVVVFLSALTTCCLIHNSKILLLVALFLSVQLPPRGSSEYLQEGLIISYCLFWYRARLRNY